ncbi:interferon-induced protein with tetratricopeptide repeats 2-like [Alosa pseudoharengus]|uniref:interferon-induced protein with tetratricopeptide repeats 2-like n=1 Tax=Alosa pseudoharengus TaxID=34774 RepID=UPI003F88FF52
MDSFQTDLRRRLESLECHFTWNLSRNVSILHRQQEHLEDRSQHGCDWEGHLYNLLGCVIYHITDSAEEALIHLRQAEVALKEREQEGRGPHLLVNQANLAWVHFHLRELPECQAYLEEVARLQEDFPAPPGCELHPEVYGEKGWTQVKFEYDLKKQAVANFEMALRGDPDRKEWHVGLAIAKYKLYEGNDELTEEIIEQIKIAKTKDPDNLHMLAIYWNALAKVGRKTEETVIEVHDLAQQLKPDLDGLGDILHFLRLHDSLDSALQVGEEIVRKHPFEREAKKQLALCYKWKIFEMQGISDLSELMKRGINIYEEVIRLYPHYLRGKMDLAGIYAKSGNVGKADQIYMDLLNNTEDLEPGARQLLYNRYGCHLNWLKRSSSESIDYHKKAAKIPKQSREREKSVKILRTIVNRGTHRRCSEIRDFLSYIELI